MRTDRDGDDQHGEAMMEILSSKAINDLISLPAIRSDLLRLVESSEDDHERRNLVYNYVDIVCKHGDSLSKNGRLTNDSWAAFRVHLLGALDMIIAAGTEIDVVHLARLATFVLRNRDAELFRRMFSATDGPENIFTSYSKSFRYALIEHVWDELVEAAHDAKEGEPANLADIRNNGSSPPSLDVSVDRPSSPNRGILNRWTSR